MRKLLPVLVLALSGCIYETYDHRPHGPIVPPLTKDEAQRLGVQQFYLLTVTAEKFFSRHWFQRIARDRVPAAVAASPEFQGLCPASAVCMTRTVKP